MSQYVGTLGKPVAGLLPRRKRARIWGKLMASAVLATTFALAACSSSSGGGSSPSRPTYIVLPNGQGSVCSNGTAPPCK
jgi:hypothetical protein